MSDVPRTPTSTAAVIMLVLGLALVIVGLAGWVTAQMRPLAGIGFALIGVGFAARGVRGLRTGRTGA